MKEKENLQMKGILLTLLGGILWGFCGSCGQFLFQYKEVTSGWLVPFRLTLAGFLILVLLGCKDRGNVLKVWREREGRRD